MKNSEVQVGNVYTAKITDKVVPVRIDKENPRGGWDATNMKTNRQVRIKSAQKLRGCITSEVGDAAAAQDAAPAKGKRPSATKMPRAKGKLAAAERKARAGGAADTTSGTINKKATTVPAKAKEKKPKKLSLIDAAAQVLATSTEPLNVKQMVEQVTVKGLWSPGSGKTPSASLYSSILRELQHKGDQARFRKVERGLFTAAAKQEG